MHAIGFQQYWRELMNLTNFLRTGVYLKLKVGLKEKNIYSI